MDTLCTEVVISDGNNREWQQPTTKAAESATGSSSNDYRAHTLLPVLQVASWTTSTWNPEELVVSGHIQPMFKSCGVISIEYVLKVYAIGSWGLRNLTVDIAIAISNECTLA